MNMNIISYIHKSTADLSKVLHCWLEWVAPQVMIELKSKHVGGAFSKKNKCKSSTFSREVYTKYFKEKRGT